MDATNNLGAAYEDGTGVKHTDWKKAQQLYRMGVDRGSARAQYSLANVMWKELQNEVTRFDQRFNSSEEYWMDTTRTSEIYGLFDLAAMQGHLGGIYMKGVCYAGGIGVEKDHVEARRCFERAAAKGHWQRVAIDGLARLDAYAAEATS